MLISRKDRQVDVDNDVDDDIDISSHLVGPEAF